MSPVRTIARPLLAAPFIIEGIDAAVRPARHVETITEDRSGAISAARSVLQTLGVPASVIDAALQDPTVLVRVSGGVTALAGIALARGKRARLAGVFLASLAVKTAVARYPVWAAEDAEERAEMISALLNRAAVVGGLLVAAADRDGKPSLGWRLEHSRQRRDEILALRDRMKKRYRG